MSVSTLIFTKILKLEKCFVGVTSHLVGMSLDMQHKMQKIKNHDIATKKKAYGMLANDKYIERNLANMSKRKQFDRNISGLILY